MVTRFISRLATVKEMHDQIGINALHGAALVVVNHAKRKTRGGFKSGRFVTTGWNLISYEIIDNPGTEPFARVGHVQPHWAYWELGHRNAWTRQYERSEWLKPSMEETRAAQQAAAEAAARQTALRFSALLASTGASLGRILR